MSKKFGLYLGLFFLVLSINLYVSVVMQRKHARLEASKRILNEIGSQTPYDYSSAPYVSGEEDAKAQVADSRVRMLKAFFRQHNSDLYDYASYIVEVSDKYQFDYRLLPAIAMQESNLCKYIPHNSYNCWGWGIYGDLTTRFDSYHEAIDTVAVGIKTHYIDQGLVTASSIMAKYTPSSNGSWARGVNTVLGWIE